MGNASRKKVIEKNFKNAKIFVAEIENKVIAFIVLGTRLWDNGMHGEINEFVVESRHQRKGIGTALLKKAESHAKKKIK